MPGGGPPMMPSRPPSRAAIYIEDGAETGGTSKLIVNDSSVTQTGSNTFTSKMTEPFSNNALLISALVQHGGYGTYADFDCSVWLYGSTLESPEVGAIIAKSGHITIADGGATLRGKMLIDGKRVTPAAGQTYTGRIAVTPL
jgi:hypothetical protein